MNDIYKKIGLLRNRIDVVRKSEKNPFFKSNYASINSIEALVEPIENEVGLTHFIKSSVDNGVQFLTLVVADIETGDTLESTLQLILPKNDMQQLIAGHTYGRRGLLVSFYSLEAIDDDGNAVAQQPKPMSKAAAKRLLGETADEIFRQYESQDAMGLKQTIEECDGKEKSAIKVLFGDDMSDNFRALMEAA